MGRTALSAAWPEIPTAPGTDRPAPDTSPPARGGHVDRMLSMETPGVSAQSQKMIWTQWR